MSTYAPSTAYFPRKCQVLGYQEELFTPDLILSLSPHVPRQNSISVSSLPFPTLFFCPIRGYCGKYHLYIFYYHHKSSLRCRRAFLGDSAGSCLISPSKSHTTPTTTCLGFHPVHAALRGHCHWRSSPCCGTQQGQVRGDFAHGQREQDFNLSVVIHRRS